MRILQLFIGLLLAAHACAQGIDENPPHAPIPDSGTTAFLLVLVITGLVALRRRKR